MRASDEHPCLRIWDVVSAIPPGRVATYGQVAGLAGCPGAARLAGRCLGRLPSRTDVPWHRVVNASGEIRRPPGGEDGARRQRELLEREGVEFRPSGRLDLRRWRWLP